MSPAASALRPFVRRWEAPSEVMDLLRCGLTPEIESLFEPHRATGLVPARVLSEHRDAWGLVTPRGEVLGEPMGRLLHQADSREDLPAVGDWVAVREAPGEDRAFVEAVLPRRSVLARKEASRSSAVQLLAANVDTLFVALSLDRDANPRKLERWVAMARAGGVEPVVLLTKSDLPNDAAAVRLAAERAAPGVPVLFVSSLSGAGVAGLDPWLAPGRTVALGGSSGAGKSTLVNRLLGRPAQATLEVRDRDGRGRHATTARQAFLLPGGALLVDTPGLREVGVVAGAEALDEAFADVAATAVRCRFRDCVHDGEPGCAVRDAVERGELDPDRLASLGKLRREAAWLEERASQSAGRVEKRRFRRMIAAAHGTDLGKRSRR